MTDRSRSELVQRYEALLSSQQNFYFDADDFDEIAFQYELSDRFNEAYEAVERGLSLHPGNSSLLVRRVRYLLALDRVEEAESQLSALPSDSEDTLLLQIELSFREGNREAGLAAVDILLQEFSLSVESCYDIMDLYVDFDYLKELSEFVERAEAQFDYGSELWRELAVIYEEKEEIDKAIVIYNRLLDADPYSVSDWFNIAKLQALKKHYDAAIDACDFALAIQEADEGIVSFKGYCLYDKGAYKEAIEVFQELHRIMKEKHVACELIAECYMKLNQYPTAVEYLLSAETDEPDSPNVSYQLATCYYQMGEIQQAEHYLLRTVDLDSNDADAYCFLGELKLLQVQPEAALKYLQTAEMLSENDPEIISFMGDALVLLQRYDEAVTYYERLFKMQSAEVKLYFKLGITLYHAGRYEEASTYLSSLEEQLSAVQDRGDLSTVDRIEMERVSQTIAELRRLLSSGLNENLES